MKRVVFYCLVLMSTLLSACAPSETPAIESPVAEPSTTEPIITSSFQLTSTAFEPGGAIPPKYACGGEEVSPHLTGMNHPPARSPLR